MTLRATCRGVAAITAGGCSGSGPQAPRLLPLEPVPLDRFEASVAQRLSSALDETRAELERADGDAARAALYGSLGQLYDAHDLPGAARSCYTNAAELQPDEARWAYYLGQVERRLGRLPEAVGWLQRAVDAGADNPAVRIVLGLTLMEDARTERAAEMFRTVLDDDPDSVAALAGLGRIVQQDGRAAAAVRHLERALELDPAATSLHYPLALAYRDLGRLEEAERLLGMKGEVPPALEDPWMDEVRRLASAGKLVHRERGTRAARAGRFAEAIEAFGRALDADPDDATTHVYLGIALWMSGERERAESHFGHALELDPSDGQANLHRGIVLALDGDDRAALRYLETAVEVDPGSELAGTNLGGALWRLGEFERALEHYRRMRQRLPDSAAARFGEAFSLVRLRRWTEARAVLEEAAGFHGEQPAFAHALARLLAAAPDPAVRDGTRALALLQDVASRIRDVDVAESIAMALAETGSFDEALRWQRGAIEQARAAGRPDLLTRMRERAAAYAAARPWREPWGDQDPLFRPEPQMVSPGG